MEEVINVLYEIEEKANRILERSNEQKQRLQQESVVKQKELEAEIQKDTDQKLSILKENMEKEIATEKEILICECKNELNKMEENFNTNHDALVEEVFNRIISL